MLVNRTILKSLTSLSDYVIEEKFKGYDPYDTLNSWLPFHWFGKWGPILAIQVQKRNPINIRPLLGISKGINPKAYGLLLKACCINFRNSNDQRFKDYADMIFNWLSKNYSDGYSGYAWGYNFDWASPEEYIKAYTPSVVVTSFVVDGLLEYYQLTHSEVARKMIIGAAEYVVNDLPITELDTGISFAYTHQSKGCCYNASLLGAEILVKANLLKKNEDYLKLAKQAVNFVLSKQKADGRWNYSYNPITKKEREQVDFHQGFILVSLWNFIKYTDNKDSQIVNSIIKGLSFYRKNQFFISGQSLWRIPKIYPVEIHNQAQGIITFAILSELDPENFKFAQKIAQWTIEYMQDKRGYFYYRVYKIYKNKISYLRWSQSWMLLALSLLSEKDNDKTL